MRLLDDGSISECLRTARTIAVLGARPESMREKAAFWIPEYLVSVGYRVVPIPVLPCDTTSILGAPVVASVVEAGRIDILSLFLRPERVPAHLADILSARPPVVWFQSGLMHVGCAEALADAGIAVAHACIGCKRAAIEPATVPLWST